MKTAMALLLLASLGITGCRTSVGGRESNEYYVRILNRSPYRNYDLPERAEEGKTESRLVRIERPSWALDAGAPPPRTPDDFVGWYQSIYLSPCKCRRTDYEEQRRQVHENAAKPYGPRTPT